MSERRPRVLCVSPHPDDASIYFGGTLAKCVQEGAVVSVVNVTDGGKGKLANSRRGYPPLVVTGQVAEDEFKRRRRQEEIAADAMLGVRDVKFLGFPDTEVDEKLVKALEVVLGIFDPSVVLSFSETGTSYERSKADHSWCGIATYQALLNLLLDGKNHIPSFRRYLTYTLPEVDQMFTNYAEIDTPSQELVTVDTTAQVGNKIGATTQHRTQAHLMGFFEATGLLHIRQERFRERIARGARIAGGKSILEGLSKSSGDNLYFDGMPLGPEMYVSSAGTIYNDVLDRIASVRNGHI